jgi:hypothetical protein
MHACITLSFESCGIVRAVIRKIKGRHGEWQRRREEEHDHMKLIRTYPSGSHILSDVHVVRSWTKVVVVMGMGSGRNKGVGTVRAIYEVFYELLAGSHVEVGFTYRCHSQRRSLM